jgi:hypothetical protein
MNAVETTINTTDTVYGRCTVVSDDHIDCNGVVAYVGTDLQGNDVLDRMNSVEAYNKSSFQQLPRISR